MPAETHRCGCGVHAESVLVLLRVLLEDPASNDASLVTLASLGVDADTLAILWEAVCGEFGERTLGPKIDPGVLDPSMTLEAAATTMAALLGQEADDGA